MGPDHSGHNMSSHDMSAHAGHDMSGHAGHDMPMHAAHAGGSDLSASDGADSSHSPFVYMGHGHGDGLLQAGVDEVLLFKGATTNSPASLLLACFVLMLLAVLLEYLRLLAWWLESRYVRCSGGRREDGGAISSCNGKTQVDSPPNTTASSSLSVMALSLLHVVIYVFSTCLMLITMTFNIYLITALGAGAATGKIATMFTRARLTPKKY